jgi:hypothetical protein
MTGCEVPCLEDFSKSARLDADSVGGGLILFAEVDGVVVLGARFAEFLRVVDGDLEVEEFLGVFKVFARLSRYAFES